MTSNVTFPPSVISLIFDRIERLVRHDDYKRRGQTDVFRGEMIKAANNEIRDIFEYFPDHVEVKVSIKLLPGGDQWSVDLINLYFAGKRNQDIVLACRTGQSGPVWITEEEQEFSCRRKPSHPHTLLKRITAHTCDTRHAATRSKRIFMKFCLKLSSFKLENATDCCRTNSFGIDGGRDKLSIIDFTGKSLKGKQKLIRSKARSRLLFELFC